MEIMIIKILIMNIIGKVIMCRINPNNCIDLFRIGKMSNNNIMVQLIVIIVKLIIIAKIKLMIIIKLIVWLH